MLLFNALSPIHPPILCYVLFSPSVLLLSILPPPAFHPAPALSRSRSVVSLSSVTVATPTLAYTGSLSRYHRPLLSVAHPQPPPVHLHCSLHLPHHDNPRFVFALLMTASTRYVLRYCYPRYPRYFSATIALFMILSFNDTVYGLLRIF